MLTNTLLTILLSREAIPFVACLLALRVHGGFEGCAGDEPHSCRSSDGQCLARLRVAATALCTVGSLEAAKAGDHDVAPLREFLRNDLDQGVQASGCGSLGLFSRRGERLDQFGFVHLFSK